ncbi:hypothetical protein BD309DRAFT_132721 [Dichomitus squalens]|nr:hypothetical protein BD309DRAFT_132721 [Dichomitus squalens]
MLLKPKKDETFFSSPSLTWQESPSSAGILVAVVHHTLQRLLISIDSDAEMPIHNLRRLITKVSVRAPGITSMVLQSPDETRSFPVDGLLKHTQLRELTLGGGIAIPSEEIRTLLSLPHLHSLQVNLAASDPCPDETFTHAVTGSYNSTTLRKFACAVSCDTATTLLSLLDAPYLESLILHVDETRFHQRRSAHSLLLRTVAGASFASSVLSLEYSSANIYSELGPKAHQSMNLDPDDIPVDLSLDQPLSNILTPFFPATPSLDLPKLERFSFDMFWPTAVQDEDVEQLSVAIGSTARILEHTPLPPSLRAIRWHILPT